MRNYILYTLLLFATVNCNKKETKKLDIQTTSSDSVSISDSSIPIEPSTLQTCYFAITEKDSLYLSLDDNLGTITGKMRYKNSEKDSSSGDVIGSQNGDTIKLNYSFQSEGISSEREIYFLKKDKNLIEGIGDHKVENSTEMYANPTKIKYEGQILKSTDCKGFDKNFVSK